MFSCQAGNTFQARIAEGCFVIDLAPGAGSRSRGDCHRTVHPGGQAGHPMGGGVPPLRRAGPSGPAAGEAVTPPPGFQAALTAP